MQKPTAAMPELLMPAAGGPSSACAGGDACAAAGAVSAL